MLESVAHVDGSGRRGRQQYPTGGWVDGSRSRAHAQLLHDGKENIPGEATFLKLLSPCENRGWSDKFNFPLSVPVLSWLLKVAVDEAEEAFSEEDVRPIRSPSEEVDQCVKTGR
jgi:hypothetical protein